MLELAVPDPPAPEPDDAGDVVVVEVVPLDADVLVVVEELVADAVAPGVNVALNGVWNGVGNTTGTPFTDMVAVVEPTSTVA